MMKTKLLAVAIGLACLAGVPTLAAAQYAQAPTQGAANPPPAYYYSYAYGR